MQSGQRERGAGIKIASWLDRTLGKNPKTQSPEKKLYTDSVALKIAGVGTAKRSRKNPQSRQQRADEIAEMRGGKIN
jgi:hypothetical protein